MVKWFEALTKYIRIYHCSSTTIEKYLDIYRAAQSDNSLVRNDVYFGEGQTRTITTVKQKVVIYLVINYIYPM